MPVVDLLFFSFQSTMVNSAFNRGIQLLRRDTLESTTESTALTTESTALAAESAALTAESTALATESATTT